ncbi:uncharacterized protein [Heterodontus francisci]|uniref:uncharacterized protein n=1 Tax=Heterodontus francisci TaxID=7792 RepID=UPI00355AEE52
MSLPAACPTQLGSTKDLDTAAARLHSCARHGRLKKMKKLLTKGADPEVLNSSGQSPLFTAALLGHSSLVDLLLRRGANPNLRCSTGCTPVHAAAFACLPALLATLLDAGGDLRLHDSEGRSPEDWAQAAGPQRNPQMLDFLWQCRSEMARLVHQNESARGSCLLRSCSSARLLTPTSSFLHLFQLSRFFHSNTSTSFAWSHSLGFGKLCRSGSRGLGVVGSTPIVSEIELVRPDNEREVSYVNGPFTVMSNRIWDSQRVTVRQLKQPPHTHCSKPQGTMDLLLAEQEHCSYLHHPNLLLLMSVCLSENLEQVYLVYERQSEFPGFHLEQIVRLLFQVCEALLFLHSHGYVHRSLTSHAVQLVTMDVAKLSNLEYLQERAKAEAAGQRPRAQGAGERPRVQGKGRGPRVQGKGRGPRVQGKGRGPRVRGKGREPRVQGKGRGPRVRGKGRGYGERPRVQGKGRGYGERLRVQGKGREPRVQGKGRGPRVQGKGRGYRGKAEAAGQRPRAQGARERPRAQGAGERPRLRGKAEGAGERPRAQGAGERPRLQGKGRGCRAKAEGPGCGGKAEATGKGRGCRGKAEGPGCRGKAEGPGCGAEAEGPGCGGKAEATGKGRGCRGKAEGPGCRGKAEATGKGRGFRGKAESPGCGGKAEGPGCGAEAEGPGCGGKAKGPGSGAEAEGPGCGGKAEGPGRGGKADGAGERPRADGAGERPRAQGAEERPRAQGAGERPRAQGAGERPRAQGAKERPRAQGAGERPRAQGAGTPGEGPTVQGHQGTGPRSDGIACNNMSADTIPHQLYNWLPPEIICGRVGTVRSDIYSFCTVIQEAFTDTVPWSGVDGLMVKEKLLSGHSLSLDPRVPLPLHSIVQTGICLRQRDRTINLQDIRFSLRHLLQVLGPCPEAGARWRVSCGTQVLRLASQGRTSPRVQAKAMDTVDGFGPPGLSCQSEDSRDSGETEEMCYYEMDLSSSQSYYSTCSQEQGSDGFAAVSESHTLHDRSANRVQLTQAQMGLDASVYGANILKRMASISSCSQRNPGWELSTTGCVEHTVREGGLSQHTQPQRERVRVYSVRYGREIDMESDSSLLLESTSECTLQEGEEETSNQTNPSPRLSLEGTVKPSYIPVPLRSNLIPRPDVPFLHCGGNSIQESASLLEWANCSLERLERRFISSIQALEHFTGQQWEPAHKEQEQCQRTNKQHTANDSGLSIAGDEWSSVALLQLQDITDCSTHLPGTEEAQTLEATEFQSSSVTDPHQPLTIQDSGGALTVCELLEGWNDHCSNETTYSSDCKLQTFNLMQEIIDELRGKTKPTLRDTVNAGGDKVSSFTASLSHQTKADMLPGTDSHLPHVGPEELVGSGTLPDLAAGPEGKGQTLFSCDHLGSFPIAGALG